MTVLLAALALAAVPARAEPGGDAFSGIPGVTFSYYDVTGTSVEAVRRALAAAQQIDPNDGAQVAAYSRWRFDWYVPDDGKGGCRLDAAQLRFSAEVRLPRLTGDVAAALRTAWQHFVAAVQQHEAGHVRYAWEQRAAVAQAIAAATCATANAAGRGAIAAIASHDRAYDRETRHGASQGAVFP